MHPTEPVCIAKFMDAGRMKSVERSLLDRAKLAGNSLEAPIRAACKDLGIEPLGGFTETFVVDAQALRSFRKFAINEAANALKSYPAEAALDIALGVAAIALGNKARQSQRLIPKSFPLSRGLCSFVNTLVKHVSW